jgi:putative heme-binding domain-containing protein
MKRCPLSIPALTFAFAAAWEFTVYAAEGALPRDVKPADGYTVSLAVPSSLVERPVEASFDDKGRLYVTEVTGTNDPPEVQLKNAPHRVLRLTDSNGDGVFDQRTVFADKLGFPEGVLWHQGAVYVSAPPQIWKFTDKDDDGVADTREVWFDGKTLTGCANDLHGPYAGPDGLLYWCKGAFAEQTYDMPNQKGWKSRAAHVFRMKPDGTGFDVVFTAGMDNPVGLAWTPEGDLIVSGTFLQFPGDGKRDGLIHAVRGGLWGKDHDVLDGHLRTGPLLPPMTHLGPAAPAGMIRYGRDLLVAQFNLRKVSRHVLEPLGATWQTTDSDFLTCDDPDFHPTDVLQSPDGSVLVVDTGGWYKLCCPTSQVAKPQVTGAIYRLRKTGGEVPAACPEPRWKLENPEPSAELVKQAQSTDLAEKDKAIAAMLKPLRDQAKSGNAHVRRMAMEALGKWPAAHDFNPDATGSMGHITAESRAVTEALLDAAAVPGADRFTGHALTYALMEGADAKGPRSLFSSSDPVNLQAAIYWLSQTDPAVYDPEMGELLSTADAGVREAAIFALRKVPAWRDAAGTWLAEQLASAEKADTLRPAVEAVLRDDGFRQKLGAWLAAAKSDAVRNMLLEVMTAHAGDKLPEEWATAVLPLLEKDAATAERAAAVFAQDVPVALREKLRAVAADAARPAGVRLALLLACGGVLAEEEFRLVAGALRGKSDGSDHSDAAARILSQAALTPAQRTALVPLLPQAALTQRPLLLRAYAASTDKALGLALVEALQNSGALASLSADDLRECLGKFPASVQERLTAARAALAQNAEKQRARIAELEKSLPAGDVQRGKVVFQSAKASCVLCHQAGDPGKYLGPDLSRIGSIRTQRDLLEAIVFPSASFVRSYEPVEITRKDGTPAYGIITNEGPDSLTLTTGAVTPAVTVKRADIAGMKPGSASLMPQGIDQILTPHELADVLAFLQSLK